MEYVASREEEQRLHKKYHASYLSAPSFVVHIILSFSCRLWLKLKFRKIKDVHSAKVFGGIDIYTVGPSIAAKYPEKVQELTDFVDQQLGAISEADRSGEKVSLSPLTNN